MPNPPKQPLDQLLDQLADLAQDMLLDAVDGLKDRIHGMVPESVPRGRGQGRATGARKRVQGRTQGPGSKPRARAVPEPRKPIRTAYTVLGVDSKAEPEVIAAAYKAKARLYHPDVTKDPKAVDRMKELNLAWEILKDANKRRAYDRGIGL